jgi:hypothetical protein
MCDKPLFPLARDVLYYSIPYKFKAKSTIYSSYVSHAEYLDLVLRTNFSATVMTVCQKHKMYLIQKIFSSTSTVEDVVMISFFTL